MERALLEPLVSHDSDMIATTGSVGRTRNMERGVYIQNDVELS